ncbi:D-ribose pyranase [Corynebacterium halotolerans]|uniref:D-ribose pyranase n=1 Tax=Corynebacterium halotolerans YIM 70093 = DSM 44683 TaxID=1121362 RepID=M1P038_9CORY|nr:D-ribose pyranase [Corynebacterium halotolerans]AGF73135.1 D-ribose pyranase [Corynebacterium halotolerans YIM 70093 = DSM 44683]
MRSSGILNPDLAARINRLGHTDTFVIADCGLPVPATVPVVDLALVFGIPRFREVVEAVLAEVVVETVTIAHQTPAEIRDLLPGEPREVSHEELKKMVASASFVIRSGETTPYANAVFHSGVPF